MKHFNRLHLFQLLLMALFMSACTKMGAVKVGAETGSAANSGGSTITFAGVTSIDQVTDSSLRLNWSNHAAAVAYQVYRIVAGTPSYLATVSAPASSHSFTGLTHGTSYTYRVRAMESTGATEANTATQTVMTSSAPTSPTALTLITPASSPSFFGTPIVQVSGVKNGDTIKLYSNSNCTGLIASGTANGVGTTIDLTSSALSAGTHTLSASATSATLQTSSCSTATLSYEKLGCPIGYIPVSPNVLVGTTSEFCVMKFEAKSVVSVATSQAALAPWNSITQIAAKAACTALGTGYDLISNPEWQTIAYSLEATAANWSGAVVGTGALFRGHTDNSASELAVTDSNDPYDGTGNTAVQAMGSGKEQKRTFTLSSGEVIWDFSGNVMEWVDWTLGGALGSGPITCNAAWTELPLVSCGDLLAAEYMPGNPAVITAANYNSTYGLGRFHGGSGGAALRGGYYDAGIDAGAFALNLNVDSIGSAPYIGFRCVYRP